jgi:hypothetical protein
MSDDLSGAVERLRSSTMRLNHLCDQAAQIVRDVEQFLEDSRVGLSASVSIGYGAWSDVADEPDWEDRLEYRRLEGGKYRIASVRYYMTTSPPLPDEVRPWSECTRDEKVDSLAILPELVVELAKSAEDRASKAEKAIAAVTPLLRLPAKRKGAN